MLHEVISTCCCFVHPAGDADIDGGWSRWSAWFNCSRRCGGGAQKRHRTCSDPHPVGGGDDCEGANIEERSCNTNVCQGTRPPHLASRSLLRSSHANHLSPVSGSWSCWSDYGACSVTCGSGVRKRTRDCSDPQNRELPGYGCVGKSAHIVACEEGPCYCELLTAIFFFC